MADGITEIVFIKNGVETPIGDIGKLVAHDGWGMTPLHRLSERGPFQHGITDLGYRLDARVATFVFNIGEDTLYDMYLRRDAILAYFVPGVEYEIKWTVGADVKCVKGFYNADMSMPWGVGEWAAQRFAISFICNDPAFYNPVPVSVNFQLGGSADIWEVPFEVPWHVGASTIDINTVVDYLGTVISYPPLIRITGPIHDPILTNYIAGSGVTYKLDFTGVTIAGGDHYDIDCRYGYKTVVNAAGTDKISELTTDSDLSEFGIYPEPEAIGGENTIGLTGSAVTASTKVEITYYNRFTGR